MISSKVNQWTLLVGALPIAYALSHGSFQSMHLDLRQREEMLLTSAQSVFAVIVISNFRFSVIEALILFGLFVPQFFLTSTLSRWALSGMFLALSLGWIIVSPSVRTGFFDLFRRRAQLPPPAHGS
jgi:cation:H+ antiporter